MKNREIKFRAWNKKFEEMWNWEDIMTINDWEFGSGIFGDEYREKWHLMQYVGIKDRKDKEIYEGDIIESSLFGPNYRRMDVVAWHGTGFNPGLRVSYPEVIGNIYENPELLNEINNQNES